MEIQYLRLYNELPEETILKNPSTNFQLVQERMDDIWCSIRENDGFTNMSENENVNCPWAT